VLQGGDSAFAGRINPSALSLHNAIHLARPDAQCITHMHHADVSAVSTLKSGYLPVDQSFLALPPVRYHAFQGLTNVEVTLLSLKKSYYSY
jgi:ribulose-5-phosphate 4-epimerase/fuculose-1-phosphate aldolase